MQVAAVPKAAHEVEVVSDPRVGVTTSTRFLHTVYPHIVLRETPSPEEKLRQAATQCRPAPVWSHSLDVGAQCRAQVSMQCGTPRRRRRAVPGGGLNRCPLCHGGRSLWKGHASAAKRR